MEKYIPAAITLISGFLGAWLGSVIALSRFRKERAFDRQLDWYERMIRALYDLAQKIDIALTFQDESKPDPKHLITVWRDVQKAHLTLEKLSQEAALYGSKDAHERAVAIMSTVQKVANETAGFDPFCVEADELPDAIELIRTLPDLLSDAAKPIAAEARRHLGIS